MDRVPAIAAVIIFVIVCVVSAPFWLFRVVDEGEVCVVTRFGRVSGVAEPGINFRLPTVDKFNCYSNRDVIYETSEQPEFSNADYTDFEVSAQTSDGQQIDVRYSVRYHIEAANAEIVYKDTGRNMNEVNERAVKFNSRSEVRLEMQNYTADQLYSGNLRDVQQTIDTNLRTLLAEQGVSMVSFRPPQN